MNKNKRNILLSAYACEPNRGSESEVGWKWSISLIKSGFNVFVVTRKNNKSKIEKEIKKRNYKNLHFLYFDFPKWFIKIIKGKKNSSSYFYFFIWQLGIFFLIKKFLKKQEINYIHHVTFVSYRFPSFLCFFKIPFIFGPIAGGDRIPFKLRKNFKIKNWIKELIRDVSNIYIKISPLMNLIFFKSKKILVNSDDTKKSILNIHYPKVSKLLAIGTELNNLKIKKYKKNFFFRVCFVGTLTDIKGCNILIKTISILYKINPNIYFTIIGQGELKEKINKFINNNKMNKNVHLIDFVNKNSLPEIYKKHDVLIAPYLRDSGSLAIIEAFENNLPVICLDNGGPKQIVNNNCGYKIKILNKSENQIINSFVKKIIFLQKNPNKINYFKKNIKKKLRELIWLKKVKKVYNSL